MIDQFIDELNAKLMDGHPGGPGYEDWYTARRRIIEDYMERAYDLGRERGKEQEAALMGMKTDD